MSFKVCQGAWNTFEHSVICSFYSTEDKTSETVPFEARRSFCSDSGGAVRIEEAAIKKSVSQKIGLKCMKVHRIMSLLIK